VFAELEPITKTRSTIETEVDIKTSAQINERDSVIVQEELQLDPHRRTCQRYIDRRGSAALQTEVAKLEEKLSSEQLLYLSSWWLLKVSWVRYVFDHRIG